MDLGLRAKVFMVAMVEQNDLPEMKNLLVIVLCIVAGIGFAMAARFIPMSLYAHEFGRTPVVSLLIALILPMVAAALTDSKLRWVGGICFVASYAVLMLGTWIGLAVPIVAVGSTAGAVIFMRKPTPSVQRYMSLRTDSNSGEDRKGAP